MIITVLDQKYKVGCERGMAGEEQEGIHQRLNEIIEWDKCSWPERVEADGKTKTEIKDFLGSDPKLEPGNCFFYDGNVIALDREDRLVLVVSETGRGALKRICDEIINVESALLHSSAISNVDYEIVHEIPEGFTESPVPFYTMRTFHEKFSFGRINPGDILKCKVSYVFPMDVYISDWGMAFNMDEVEEDMLDYLKTEILAWFYKNFERNLPPKPKEPSDTPEAKEEENAPEQETADVGAVLKKIKEDVANGQRYSDGLDSNIQAPTGTVYYRVSHCDETGSTCIGFSKDPEVKPWETEWEDYAAIAKKFEEDFSEYRVEEEGEGVFSVCKVKTFDCADAGELRKKLESRSDYSEAPWEDWQD